MPKLNIYADNELVKRIKTLSLPLSQICQDALWAAVEKEEASRCATCEAPASFHIRAEGGAVYACKKHLVLHLGSYSEVRAL